MFSIKTWISEGITCQEDWHNIGKHGDTVRMIGYPHGLHFVTVYNGGYKAGMDGIKVIGYRVDLRIGEELDIFSYKFDTCYLLYDKLNLMLFSSFSYNLRNARYSIFMKSGEEDGVISNDESNFSNWLT